MLITSEQVVRLKIIPILTMQLACVKAMTMDDLESTWLAVKSGSSKAWNSLLRALAPVVYTVARRRGLDRSDSEEIAQQTWMALYVARDKIEDPVALPAWLIRVASRKARRLIHDRMRQRDLPAKSGGSPALLPDEELLSLERQAFLRLAMSHLDDRCRRLIEQLFLTHPPKSYRQIAKDLGLRPNSLGPIRSRCLKKLREILEDFDL
jgi:RNA polymerase sigma factor (sigma-70 family)